MKRYTVDDEWDGARIDRLLRALHPRIPFTVIQTLLRRGKVILNGKRVGGGARLAAGDTLEIREELGRAASGTTVRRTREPASRTRVPASGKRRLIADRRGPAGASEITVLYEDDDVLVMDKPAGIVVQPGNRKELGSILDLLEVYRSRTAAREGGSSRRRQTAPAPNTPPAAMPSPFPYTPVHRLDRETTGTLVIAKTRTAARLLSAAFSSGRIEKRYLAVVEGTPSPRRGTITLPLRIEKGRRSTARAAPGGRRATTEYTVLHAISGGRSLLEIHITTGRTHQIRAHLAAIGHPVAGDRRYGRATDERRSHEKTAVERGIGGRRRGAGGRRRPLMLHAWKISFPHPAGGIVEVIAPPPPWAT